MPKGPIRCTDILGGCTSPLPFVTRGPTSLNSRLLPKSRGPTDHTKSRLRQVDVGHLQRHRQERPCRLPASRSASAGTLRHQVGRRCLQRRPTRPTPVCCVWAPRRYPAAAKLVRSRDRRAAVSGRADYYLLHELIIAIEDEHGTGRVPWACERRLMSIVAVALRRRPSDGRWKAMQL
jgi:hypothetical protein